MIRDNFFAWLSLCCMLWGMPFTKICIWIHKFRDAAQCVANQTDRTFLDEPLILLSILCWTWKWGVNAFCSVLEEGRCNEMLHCYFLRNWEFPHWNFHVRSIFSVFRKSLGIAMLWIKVSLCICKLWQSRFSDLATQYVKNLFIAVLIFNMIISLESS